MLTDRRVKSHHVSHPLYIQHVCRAYLRPLVLSTPKSNSHGPFNASIANINSGKPLLYLYVYQLTVTPSSILRVLTYCTIFFKGLWTLQWLQTRCLEVKDWCFAEYQLSKRSKFQFLFFSTTKDVTNSIYD